MNLPALDSVLPGSSGMAEFAANWLLQSTLLLAGGLLIGAALRHYGSAVQSAVYRTTLLAVLVAPAATALVAGAGFTGWSIRLTEGHPGAEPANYVSARSLQEPTPGAAPLAPTDSPATQSPATGKLAPLAAASSPSPAGVIAEPEAPVVQKQPEQSGSWPPGPVDVLALLWIAVSLILLVRLAAAAGILARLRRSALAAEPESLELLRGLAKKFGVRPPELWRSAFISSACLAGIWRPVILLPEEAMPLPLREVLAHELAHLRRRDCFWKLLSQIAKAVFFFQPLLWLVSRRMEATAEEVCDDVVVELGAEPATYASRLVDLAEQSLKPINAGVGIVRIRSLLETRVRRILEPSRRHSTTLGRKLSMAVLSGGIAATLVAGLIGATDRPQAGAASGDPLAPGANAASQGTLRGVVRDSGGELLAEAPVYLIAHVAQWEHASPNRIASRPEVAGSARTDREGQFELPVDAASERIKGYQIVAHPPGHGIAPGPWLVDLIDAFEQTHELVAGDVVEIEGQVLSPDGRPVSGAEVRLARISLQNPTGEWRGLGVLLYGLYWLDPFFEFWPAPIRTDHEGRFDLSATGAGSIAELVIQADGYAPAKIKVATAETAAAYDSHVTGATGKRDPVLNPNFTYTLAPPWMFEGTVTDGRTDRPLEGAEIVLRSADYGPFDWHLTTTTDAEGYYRLEAAPAGWVFGILASHEGYIGYHESLSADTVERAIEASGMVRQDIKLTRGVQVHGQVIDEATGAGMPRVAVTYHPDDDNLAKRSWHSFWNQVVLTDAEGRFVIPTLPLKGHLLAEVNSDEYIRKAYPTYTGGVRPHGEAYPHAFIEIDIPEAEERDALGRLPSRTSREPGEEYWWEAPGAMTWEAPVIALQKGEAVEVRLVGPHGEAVEKFHVASLETSGSLTDANLVSNLSPHRGGRHRLVGLSQTNTFRTFFYSPDLNAGAIVDLKYDPARSEPREVRLQPSATVRGRLVYEDGTPAENVLITPKFVITDDDPGQVDFWGSRVAHLGNVTHPKPANLRTGANGAFERTGFFPGAFALLSLNQEFADGARHHPIGPLEAGEIRDLGTLLLKR